MSSRAPVACTPPKFSVIIPLEFHRGMVERSVRGWSAAQDFPRDRFEIIIAAPVNHPAKELAEVRAMLAPHDRILSFHFEHDMDLVAQAALETRGEILVFTEAHCIPEPDFLSAAHRTLTEQPEWAGFSGQSRPLTHNLLSQVEAEMYVTAIGRNMREHPWLKILDQCLVLRRAAYLECGGIESGYGHFAEWLLGARLHQHGLRMGYAPAAAIHHYYIGEFDDVMIFTQDFAKGQMRFAMREGGDPCAGMFESPECWQDRAGLNRRIAWKMTRLVWRAGKRVQGQAARKEWRGRLWTWTRRTVGGLSLEWHSACKRARKLRRETQRRLDRSDREGARSFFHQLILACGRKGHLQALREEKGKAAHAFHLSKRSGQWLPSSDARVIQAGFFSRGEVFGRTFCWTHPEAMLWLPLKRGAYRVRIHWIEFPALPGKGRYRFYQDEREIDATAVQEVKHGVELTLHVRSRRGARLGWSCEPHRGSGEFRPLGMPLVEVKWKAVGSGVDSQRPSLGKIKAL
jgi:hypothetical protein